MHALQSPELCGPDPKTTQKVFALMKADNEAVNNNDPTARAALYTRGAVFVTDSGPFRRERKE
jgi:hypothetical protein